MALAGAVVGGAIGLGLAQWLWTQGFYALVLPGAVWASDAAGPCGACRCHWVSRRPWRRIALGLFTEWHLRPFNADEGFGYFVRHVGQLSSTTLFMVGMGTVMGYWLDKKANRPINAAAKDSRT